MLCSGNMTPAALFICCCVRVAALCIMLSCMLQCCAAWHFSEQAAHAGVSTDPTWFWHCVLLLPLAVLQVGESRRKVDMLREAAQGGLGLGSGGKAARGQQVRTTQCQQLVVEL
jgi:hypothetical protein